MDDLALLRLELETLWVTDELGRLSHCRTDDHEPAPLLVVGTSAAGICWATSAAVPAVVADRVAALLASEPAVGASVGWAPRHSRALVDALGSVGDLAPPHGGPSYVVPSDLRHGPAVGLRSSADPDAAATVARVPAADRALTAPWVAATVDGQVAAVCETARSAPSSVEAGVWSYELYRRRGLAAAVTATWATLVRDRTAFYSTSWDNAASQGVARTLGLRPLGQWWQLSTANRDPA